MDITTKVRTTEVRIARQLSQYKFPYHWLPELTEKGVTPGRSMQWALEYCGYMSTIVDEIKKVNAKSVIDVGCGDGRLGAFLRAQKQHTYLGIDISPNAISFASVLNPAGKYYCGRLSDIEEKFDVAAAVEVLEHIPDEDLESFLAEIRNAIKPKGILIISVPTTIRKTHPKHFRHYDEQELALQLTNGGFTVVNMFRVHRDNWIARVLQVILTNRVYSLNASILTRFIWLVYKHRCLIADRNDGAHIIAVATAEAGI